MNVCNLPFLAALLLASAVIFQLPAGRPRQVLIALGSAWALWLAVPDALSLGVLAAFVLSGYVAARLLTAHPSRLGAGIYITLLVAAFAVLNRYALLGSLAFDHPIHIVGLSYMLFRQIHFVVDAMQGQIARPSLWTYLNYQLNVFVLIAGPIQRYQQFQESWDELQPLHADTHEQMKDILRVFGGIVQVALLGAMCLARYEDAAGDFDAAKLTGSDAIGAYVKMFYLYPAYVYFNFAGYCDIVIGGAALVGLRLPENFRRPYLARNMIDFWTRWHITLGTWVRDYLFTPLYMAVARRWPRRAPHLAFACYFVALLLAGIWHGSTWNFVLFGLFHGAGVSATKLWEGRIIKKHGRKGLRRYLESRRTKIIATIVTFHFVWASLFFFVATDVGGLVERVSILLHAVR